MTLAAKLMSSCGEIEPLWVDSVFSAYTYTGNGSTQTINNGIDLAGKGGMVWVKSRSTATGHMLASPIDAFNYVSSNSTSGYIGSGINTLGVPSGFKFNSAEPLGNVATTSYASWTFRKSPKFFDVVAYTGNSTAPRVIPHSLGSVPGMILIKATSTTGDWLVYHAGLGNAAYLVLNTTSASASSGGIWNSTTPTATSFTIGSALAQNTAGVTYVAYLFAHDTAADGIVQCGSFTTDGSGNATVNLGWEPQYLMLKASASVNGWWLFDTARGLPAAPGTVVPFLSANTTSAEASFGANIGPTATGFAHNGGALGATTAYVYLAVRRPNKPPTLGTQVYSASARTGTGAAATVTGVGFAPDLHIAKARTIGYEYRVADRLRGAGKWLQSQATDAEASTAGSVTSFNMDGISVGSESGVNVVTTYINHFFKRAPGVFDQVCYTGTGSPTNISHNLGVAPELILIKCRSVGYNWRVMSTAYGWNMTGNLNTTAAFNSTPPVPFGGTVTSTYFDVYTSTDSNANGATFVAYMFATKAGISKVGSYTGNGTSQTVNCGFTTGSRFILIKRTDSTGDWFVYDTVRGIVAGNDPHLSLNTTAAEVTTDDSIDPDASGFVVNQLAATNLNVTSASYIFLSFA